MSTESTTPLSALLVNKEHSLVFFYPVAVFIIILSIINSLPMIGSSSSTLVPGGTIPSLSILINSFPAKLSTYGFVILVSVKLSVSLSSASLYVL
jgi:hypothetical protein